ncbi:CBS domain-containing protein [Nitrososphaera viennensis]|nr:CBS domain-containing protein [Nitrososphaera viennensis]UVS69565.1 CBS domain-containing protein [Nitrososphaera viennensis]
MLQVATFIATGPQIYVDGLVVLEENKLAGRIGGYALANHILKTRERWLDGKALQIMEALEHALREDDSITKALRVFMETRFAFMPVSSNGKIVASLSLRDLINYAMGLKVEVQGLTSPLLTIDNDTSVLDALEFMVEKGVRNIVFLKQDGPYVINDRKILAYLLHSQTRDLISRRGFEVLATIKVIGIGALKGTSVDLRSEAGSVAHLFSNIETSCLFVGNRILTPWDLVMKGSGFIS